MRIAAVMAHPVITIGSHAPLKEAAKLIAEQAISGLPVVDSTGSLIGIVTEADLLPIEARPDPRAQATPLAPTAHSTPRTVGDVMTRTVITVDVNADVSQAARLMIEADVKRLPVMDGSRLVGIVSRLDLVKVIARRDEDLKWELDRRLHEAGVGLPKTAVAVENGVATIQLEDQARNRRLAESVALTVPGVLEVRFEG